MSHIHYERDFPGRSSICEYLLNRSAIKPMASDVARNGRAASINAMPRWLAGPQAASIRGSTSSTTFFQPQLQRRSLLPAESYWLMLVSASYATHPILMQQQQQQQQQQRQQLHAAYHNQYGSFAVQGESTSHRVNRKNARLRLPVELYRPILLHVQRDHERGRRDLQTLLLVSKSMCREVQKILYHTLVLDPDSRQPDTIGEEVAQMVRAVRIKLGIRRGASGHTRWCMELLPRLLRLERLEIRGRAWEASVFDSCLPRTWDRYEGITGVKSFTFDGSVDLPVIRFLAAQTDLRELEIVSSPVSFSPADVPQLFSKPYLSLSRVTVPHIYANSIVRLAPNLKHLSLTFDFTTTSAEVSETLHLLPHNLESLILDTTRRDFLPSLAYLPHGLRRLSTVFVHDEVEQLLLYLSPLQRLEVLVLNVHQPSSPSFINPFAPGATPASPQSILGNPQGFDTDAAEYFITRLKGRCASLKNVQVDDQVFNRTGNIWEDDGNGGMSRRGSHAIRGHRQGSAAQLWEGLV